MSRLEMLEQEIRELAPEDLRAFREWYAEFEAAAWDRELERDADNPKLAALADQALKDHRAGRSTKF